MLEPSLHGSDGTSSVFLDVIGMGDLKAYGTIVCALRYIIRVLASTRKAPKLSVHGL